MLKRCVRLVLTVAAFAFAEVAAAQMYSWNDPATGGQKLSNIAPSWYRSGEDVRGPRVVVTIGERIVDDTSLPLGERLDLSNKSQRYIAELQERERQRALALQRATQRQLELQQRYGPRIAFSDRLKAKEDADAAQKDAMEAMDRLIASQERTRWARRRVIDAIGQPQTVLDQARLEFDAAVASEREARREAAVATKRVAAARQRQLELERRAIRRSRAEGYKE